MTAAQRKTEIVEAAPQGQPVTVLDLVARLLENNPAANIETIERLMAMRERENAQASERAFNEAMTAAQAEMRPVAADASNPQTRSKYASYFALDKAMRPIYTRHGFSLSFDEEDSTKPDHIRVLCYVSHTAGHTRTYRKDMPADGKGAKGGDVMSKTHASGAATTYGQRYLLKMIFNIAVGEDDDGRAAGIGDTILDAQAAHLDAMLTETGADKARFLRFFKIESLADLPAARWQEAVKMLEAKQAQRQGQK